MRAYVINRSGGPEVLTIDQVDEPDVRSGTVRVKVQSIGLNYAEIQSRKGLYGWAPKRPYILGMEAFGYVDAVADDVTSLVKDQAVIVANQYGCYAAKVVVPAAQALPVIDYFTPAENAAFAVQYMTAWVALMKICRIQTGESVLVQAAAGGVGTAAVQIAVGQGCRVFGTAGSDDKLELIRSLGAELAINYRSADFAQLIRSHQKGAGVDAILEVVGGEVFRKSLDLLDPYGRLAVVGFASLNLKKLNPWSWWKTWRAIPRVSISSMATASQIVGASHLGYLLRDEARMTDIWNKLKAFTMEHDIRPVVGHEFAFEDMPEAHALMESRQSTGKIVVHV
ncbi:MAG: zinc-binding dehydrogenase [Candidatus Marinimicrobia bacterium]|nr:zinc-binding dehydrogenase [Candidatus Neomarinimicrobiota bacterium]MCF7850239.1 zinc-binding dehydrogenase [Candidatus Neomarinimicrobiota bacterium]MCF7903719.1 zinc-binding dehydrogenase [Candidatus Neomarinimicrobiota bacterium]